ncbi:MAG: nucleoside-diphosphate sugar epimerase/dehydratase [Candidatus Aminicenantales bacterium]
MNNSTLNGITKNPIKSSFKRWNQLVLDVFIFICAYVFAFIIRFEGLPSGINLINLKQLYILFPFIVLARLMSFYFFSIYFIAWRYISATDAISIGKACAPLTVLLFLGRMLLPYKLSLLRIPLSIIALEFLMVLFGTLGVRMTRRLIWELSERERLEDKAGGVKKKRILLIGAGAAGNMVIKELKQRTDLGIDVIGFIDDDPKKLNKVTQGTKVLGNTTQIPDIVKKLSIDETIITIANASSKDIRRIIGVCEGTKIKVKIVPALFEILDDKVRVSKIREINIDDLLGRSVVNFKNHLPEIVNQYQDKKILITGAGGSIGSELCRQLAYFVPKELILVDKDENSIYEIDFELNSQHAKFKITPFIADIRNFERLKHAFEKYRPEVIFHAAAHKHVPLMEFNIPEAILNNIVGTINISRLAAEHQAERFVFISTDKAVNPTSVMGASKKIGEIIIQENASQSNTKYSCVRFGNVLGSRGSVVPLFQKQIALGGPLTITHPDVKRYFMSISEAVQLIIQAGTLGNKGEIFVLDMGEPITIQELAKDLLKLSGVAEDDIEIKYVGMRPGEKLYEEILIHEEKTKATQFEKIFIAPPVEIDKNKFSNKLNELINAARACDENNVIGCLKDMQIAYNSLR